MKSFIQTGKMFVRKALQIDKDMFLYGLRIFVISIPPIFIGFFTGHLTQGIFCFITALFTALADVGGAYRQRAFSMGAAALMMAISAPIAILLGNNPWFALPLMFCWVFGGSMMGVFGNVGVKVSFVGVGFFLALLGFPGNPSTAAIDCLATCIGGCWALIISLALWPFQPYQPARVAVSNYYRALRTFIVKADDPHPANVGINSRWIEAAKRERANVVTAQNNAHNVMVALHTERTGASLLDQHLLLLTLNADRLFDEVIALSAAIEHASRNHGFDLVRAALSQAVPQLASGLNDLAQALEDHQEFDCHPTLQALVACQEQLREGLLQLQAHYEAMAHVRSIVSVLDHMRETLCSSSDSLLGVQSSIRRSRRVESRTVQGQQVARRISQAIELLKDNLTPRSIIFRYALRVAVTSAVAIALYSLLGIAHGYWITLAAFSILRPDFGTTWQRAVQRTVGSVMGGIIAAIIVALIHNVLIVAALLIIFSFLAYTHLKGHYGICIVFITAFVVMVLNMGQPGEWQVALLRIGNTFVGAALAFLAGYLFWPQWERERLPSQLVKTIEANRNYFHAVLMGFQHPDVHRETLQAANRKAHLENANAAAAFQRLLSEPKTQRGDVARFSALVTYNLNFQDSITFLAEHRTDGSQPPFLSSLTEFSAQTENVLLLIEKMVMRGPQPVPASSLEESLHTVRVLLERLLVSAGSELKTHQADNSKQVEMMDHALVSAQLNRIMLDITGMIQMVHR